MLPLDSQHCQHREANCPVLKIKNSATQKSTSAWVNLSQRALNSCCCAMRKVTPQMEGAWALHLRPRRRLLWVSLAWLIPLTKSQLLGDISQITVTSTQHLTFVPLSPHLPHFPLFYSKIFLMIDRSLDLTSLHCYWYVL